MLKNFLQKNYLNIIILAVSFFISLIFVEFIVRIFFPSDFEAIHYAFMTKPLFQDQENAFMFKENTNIREVVLYWTGTKFLNEYDTTYTTNNIGLVQKNLFDPKREAIVFIGDSFTQGNGAVPWFYKLEKNWPSSKYQLINLGMMGTGVVQWKYMLQWFSKLGKIKHLFICFISQDWNRIRWVPREDPDGKSFSFVSWSQRSELNKNYNNPFYYINKDMSDEEIFKYANVIKNQYNPSFYSADKSFLSNFRWYKILRYKYDTIKYLNSETDFNNNKTSFEEIISEYGSDNITFFHIPQKEEILQGSYIHLGQKVKALILSHNLKYIDGLALCGLTVKDYYNYDPHPNTSGYEKIYHCLLNYRLKNSDF
jgi:hypothetical protein